MDGRLKSHAVMFISDIFMSDLLIIILILAYGILHILLISPVFEKIKLFVITGKLTKTHRNWLKNEENKNIEIKGYPEDWNYRRNEIFFRYKGICQNCGIKLRKFHIHHILPLSQSGNNDLSNLTLLCEECHSKAHGGRDFSEKFTHSETAISKRLSTLQYAIEQGKSVEFDYRKSNERKYKRRTFKPMELINISHVHDNGQTLCVQGFCELNQANRTFAIKRMRELKIILSITL